MIKKDAIIVDIDGVILNNGYLKHNEPSSFNWAEFMAWDKDWCEVIPAGVELVRALEDATLADVIFLTARPAFMREQTVALLKVAFGSRFSPRLYMCDDETADAQLYADDHRIVQAEYKKGVVGLLQHRFNFKYFIDDQEENCEAIASLGIPTIQPHFI